MEVLECVNLLPAAKSQLIIVHEGTPTVLCY